MAKEWINDSRNRHFQPFCGVDGEGGDIPDPAALFGTAHAYQLLRAGEFSVENPDGLDFWECARFLCSLPQKRIYVAYFFDYDVTMILKSLPEERVRRIMDRSLRDKRGDSFVTLPVDVGEYQVDYLPHKEFKIKRMGQDHFTIISDVGQFFQTSFLKTLEKWNIGTAEEREMIRKGKAMRGDFHGMDKEIRAYNALEIVLLERLMHEFRSVCFDTGYVPKKWQGPGHLASAMLDAHGVPKSKAIPILKNDEFRRLANDAYYGGRFETTATGPVHGPVYQYDINSAYPSVLRELPCLAHGSWRRIRQLPNYSDLWFGQVYFYHDQQRAVYNLPVRDKNGNICYPREGNGVYWSTELAAANRAGTECALASGWIYESHCDCRWFSFIDAYYARRLALGKGTKGYVLKLAGNSIYGKLAQSIGYAPYANPVWAGLITAGCRAQLVDAYSGHENSIVMLATDGLFTLEKLNVQISRELGEWEETVHENGIFIVQPGIYYLPDGDVKTRGIERGRISDQRDAFEATWQKYVESHGLNHTVSVQVDNFITCKQALVRRKWNIAGTWEKTTREISFDSSTKRAPSLAYQDTHGNFRTLAPHGDRALMSVGYDRLIGGDARPGFTEPRWRDPGLQENDRMADQPDWVAPLIARAEPLSFRYPIRLIAGISMGMIVFMIQRIAGSRPTGRTDLTNSREGKTLRDRLSGATARHYQNRQKRREYNMEMSKAGKQGGMQIVPLPAIGR